MLIKLAHFLEIMLYVLVAGVMWGTWLALGRTMTQYGAGTFLTDGKHMIANLGVVMAVLIIAAVVAGLVAAFWLFRARSTTAAWLALAGLLLMVAVLVVTLAVEVPIDNKISSWSVATLPPDWRDIRAQWAGLPHAAHVPLAGGRRRGGGRRPHGPGHALPGHRAAQPASSASRGVAHAAARGHRSRKASTSSSTVTVSPTTALFPLTGESPTRKSDRRSAVRPENQARGLP